MTCQRLLLPSRTRPTKTSSKSTKPGNVFLKPRVLCMFPAAAGRGPPQHDGSLCCWIGAVEAIRDASLSEGDEPLDPQPLAPNGYGESLEPLGPLEPLESLESLEPWERGMHSGWQSVTQKRARRVIHALAAGLPWIRPEASGCAFHKDFCAANRP